MSVYAYSTAYTQAHSIVFLSDNLRNTLREVIRENGLTPEKLMGDWAVVGPGITALLQSGHLTEVVVEFFKPGTSQASARWEFPITYSGSGVDDDMWLDKAYLRQLIAKAARPTPDCTYRVVLRHTPGAPDVPGLVGATLLSTGNLVARQAGTVIATGHVSAGATYWK